MENNYRKLKGYGVIPVIALDRAEDADPLAEALCSAELPVAEITFRTEAAEEAIRRMTARYPEMCVGAGTVLNVEQAERALQAGARFIVMPGFDSAVVTLCQKQDIPVFPGGVTPTELMAILAAGCEVVKFFPSREMGGLATIQALGAPFTNVSFLPTGGISAANLREYLQEPKILACGGSWMVKKDLINGGQFEEIGRLCAEAVAIVREVRG